MSEQEPVIDQLRAQSLAQDLLCIIEELATWQAIKTRRDLKHAENARRLALKAMAVQMLMAMHRHRPPGLQDTIDKMAKHVSP